VKGVAGWGVIIWVWALRGDVDGREGNPDTRGYQGDSGYFEGRIGGADV